MTTEALSKSMSWTITRRLTALHFSNDFFTGGLAILLAAQQGSLDLSNTEIGIAGALFQGISITQPALGWLTDKIERSYFMFMGALVSALGLLICAFADTTLVIFMGAFIMGIGNAALHPVALASARAYAPARGKGRSVALFMLGGNSAFALSPLIFGLLFDNIGLKTVAPVFALFAVIIPVLTRSLSPYVRGHIKGAKSTPKAPAIEEDPSTIMVAGRWWQTARVMMFAYLGAVLMTNIISMVLGTFLPVYYTSQDRSLEFAGFATAVLLMAAAFGSFVGASLSDYISRRIILTISLLVMTPGLLLLLNMRNDIFLLLLSVILGLAVNANKPILLMVGQEILPGGAVSASGFAFGLSFVSGALGVFLVGGMADIIGLGETLQVVAFLPLLAIGLIFLLPDGGNDVGEA
ncbi:MAG: MFS transporter [Chloroflexi bacterium]|nr:MFS transporter [Chloroflexota bacterium]